MNFAFQIRDDRFIEHLSQKRWKQFENFLILFYRDSLLVNGDVPTLKKGYVARIKANYYPLGLNDLRVDLNIETPEEARELMWFFLEKSSPLIENLLVDCDIKYKRNFDGSRDKGQTKEECINKRGFLAILMKASQGW